MVAVGSVVNIVEWWIAVAFWSALAVSPALFVVGVVAYVRGQRRPASLLILSAALLCGAVPVAARSSLVVFALPVALFFLTTAVVVWFSSVAEAR